MRAGAYAPLTFPLPSIFTAYMRASAVPMMACTVLPSSGAVARPTLALTLSRNPFFISNSVSINARCSAVASSSAALAPVSGIRMTNSSPP